MSFADFDAAAARLRASAGPTTTAAQAAELTDEWANAVVPASWRAAADDGGPPAVRAIRTRDEYRAWYPAFGGCGLVAATWPVEYGGLDWPRDAARAADAVLSRFHLPRLNPLGLNQAAAALFAYGSHEQRLRFLPPIVRADEIWCQLFSEPGSGSDLASLSTRAERDGDDWVITGQKIWTTWADRADFAVLLARTDPSVPKHRGLTFFLIHMHQPRVEPRPLMHMGGEVEFFATFLDGARIPDDYRVGDVGAGWRVAQATLGSERQMVAGAGSGGVDRIGGAGAEYLITLARERAAADLPGGWDDPAVRARVIRLWCEEQVRLWTNQRVRDRMQSGMPPGPESSIGKVHGSDLNQRIQSAAADLLGLGGIAWPGDTDPVAYASDMPVQVRGMLRSRANSIEGGTTEVNKNLIAERVLGLPKDVDPWRGKPWSELPRG